MRKNLNDIFKLLELQQYGCAICNVELVVKFSDVTTTKKLAAIDHCHKTGRTRGVLCYGCNSNLGRYERHNVKGSWYNENEKSIEEYLAVHRFIPLHHLG